ncbi:MAG: LLM class flavin-dependent oxidoreductase, partial [Chloroflexota bacterium]|nr:LLM class flavin-dependent oxidoreductase [Chloroflexota bacterium]
RMQASVRMLKQAMRDGRIDHSADEAYPAVQQRDLPRSVQRPHPPFMVGGGGPRVLRFAAREAQIVAIDPRSLPSGGTDPADVTQDAVDRKIAWIREAAAERWEQIEVNIAVFGLDAEFHRRRGAPPERGRDIAESDVASSPHYLVGDAHEMIDTLLARRERLGISYLALRPGHLAAMNPVLAALATS